MSNNSNKVAKTSLIIYPFYLVAGLIAFICCGVGAFGSWGANSSVSFFMKAVLWLFSAPYIILVKFGFVGGLYALIISSLIWCYLVPFGIVYMAFYLKDK